MSKLRISLFGKFSVAYNDELTDSFHVNKVQELLCYLLLQRHRPHAREALAELLWGNTCENRSKSYLRKALWQLQVALAAFSDATGPFLDTQADYIHLNAAAIFWLDVAIFEDAFHQVQGITGQQLKPCQVDEVETAVSLYHSDLLEGWYQEWCLYERERFQQMLLILLDKLMGYCEVSGEYEKGLDYGSRILRYDQARERAHRGLMRLHYLNGDRTEALRQYERCTIILDKELGVAPAEQTVNLYQQIRHGQPVSLTSPFVICTPIPPASSLTEVLGHLRQFQTNLASMEQQVQLDIDIVEKHLQNQVA